MTEDSAPWKAGPADTVTSAFARIVVADPDRVFLEVDGDALTYGEFDRRIRELAFGLAGLGVARGDRVASLLDNSVDAAAVWFATMALGAIYVPINTANRADYLRHQLDDCGARIVISEGDLVERILELEVALAALEVVVARGDSPGVGQGRLRREPFESLAGRGAVASFTGVAPRDLAALIYTSGTTGPSKGCMLSHGFLCYVGNVPLFGAGPGEVAWTALPLFHLSAMASVLATMMQGGTVSVARRFSVSGFWPEIERTGAHIVSLLGTMATLVAHDPESEAMARCRGQLVRVMAAPMDPEVQEIFKSRFGVQHTFGAWGYGMTEGGPFFSVQPGRPTKPGSSGVANPNFDVQIVDENDNPLPANEVGEIIVRPRRPHVMFDGYWARPAETLGVFRNLWFHTGDLGRVDEDGCFFFVDRKKDYIRRRGENISSAELEGAARQHPDVAEVAAYGVPSELGEDDVEITVVLVPDAETTESALCQWLADQVPYFAVPRYIRFVPALPKNAIQKVQKQVLRDEAGTVPRWDREAAGLSVGRR